MREVTIALAQMSPLLNQVEQNLTAMSKFVEDICLQQKVDLIIFPELCTTGYECGVKFANLAERVDEHTVNTLSKQAAEYGTHILFGLAEKQKVESVVYSAAVLIDPEGEVLADYQKVHLKGEQRLTFRPGFRTVTVETTFGVVGLLVGWDLAFPEAARCAALAGAELHLCLWKLGKTPCPRVAQLLLCPRLRERRLLLLPAIASVMSQPIPSLAIAWWWVPGAWCIPGSRERIPVWRLPLSTWTKRDAIKKRPSCSRRASHAAIAKWSRCTDPRRSLEALTSCGLAV